MSDTEIRPRTTDEKSLELQISDCEREQLSLIQSGVAEIRVYKASLYPTVVSFFLADGNLVTVRARGVGIAPRFEVFPISVSAELLKVDAELVIDCKDHSGDLSIFLLSKAEWSVPTTPEDQAQLLGDPEGSTTQYEGKADDIPANALDSAVYDAGIEIRSSDGWSFIVASSMFPFALYVSNCDFSEAVDGSLYDRLTIC
jgi:hypothetical protein